jgi:hypothetical protein
MRKVLHSITIELLPLLDMAVNLCPKCRNEPAAKTAEVGEPKAQATLLESDWIPHAAQRDV